MGDYITYGLADLQGKDKQEALELVEKAKTTEFLSQGELPGEESRRFVYYGGSLIGFYSPFEQELQGQRYWRAGPLYIKPVFSGEGHMRQVLQEFFNHHVPGLAWIDDENKNSQHLFVRLGFKRHSPHPGKGGRSGWWYTNLDQVTPAKMKIQAGEPPQYSRW